MMRTHRLWRWLTPRREAATERVQAEAQAERVEREVIGPLRDVRARALLSDAVRDDMRRKLQGG